ncbi:lipopolysaccharide transport periplasmic protein LptA [uncultured Thiothrix sp.]|uniref:lipopolysaccharide transport periplasmic protein LptA n=1 Tax=uncultured Thiothrix sp. TaxID=223185 RepID=UPI002615F335|nr:lipopolysaccharide transport periplasmic protein LptA [uncultured Thiothrix sp.]HMT93563.1 lipopolysaccharide transport periplasmic protein LptA [Thiolinea sp.]
MLNQPINPLLQLFTSLCLLASTTAYAISSDAEKPVMIESDSVVFNKEAGTAVYAGNVEIKQGTLSIRASRIEISAPDNEIQTIKATGSPVNFQQTMDSGKQALGRAKNVQYFVIQKKLVLEGDASLSQDRDNFASNRIEYSTANGELKAGGQATTPGEKSGRVRAIFYPTNKAQ